MKKLLFFLFLLIPSVVFSQTSICGVDFGSSYSTAETVLENKFGDKDALYSDKTQIVFENKMYAGRLWSRMIFIFQSDGYHQYFNRCILIRECENAKQAKEIRDAIKTQMEDKYFIKDFKDEKTGFIFYWGGTSPTDSYMPGFTIDIIKYKDKGYAARLDYGPYNYVKEEL